MAGGIYFFTVALADRRDHLLTREITALREAVMRTRSRHPFHVDAWVMLPEHMHAVWTLPSGDAAYSLRWGLIKRWFSAAIPSGEDRSASRAAKGERGIWQRRFWEHTVRDAEDFAWHVDYVHFNPVKHGLAQSAADWPLLMESGTSTQSYLAGDVHQTNEPLADISDRSANVRRCWLATLSGRPQPSE